MLTISQTNAGRRRIARNGIRCVISKGLAVVIAGSLGSWYQVSSASETDGLRTNPFASSEPIPESTPGATPSVLHRKPVPDWRPVATAKLQMPTVQLPTPQAGPTSKTVSAFVGPDWSQYEPAIIEQPAGAALPMLSVNTETRPSRLPAISTEVPNLPSRTNALLVGAARKRSQYIARQLPEPRAGASVYLATQTAQSQLEIAAKLFKQSQLDYDYRAYASAETAAWQSLEKSVQAIDLAASMNSANANLPSPDALQKLHRGKRAIIEACDFVGPFAQNDAASIARLARAHETPVVRESLPPIRPNYAFANHNVTAGPSAGSLPSASEAIDRYLDFARSQFGELAAQSLLAAQTMDLLAAIRLGRNELDQLPGPTAICLRRAAVQGQSNNADLVGKLGHQLADVGLIDEAKWALGHSLSIAPNPANMARLRQLNSIPSRAVASQYGQSILAATQSNANVNRVPEVIALSPTQFASISTSVLPGKRPSTDTSVDRADATRSQTLASQTPITQQTSQPQLSRTASASSRPPVQTASHYGGPPVIPASARQPAARTSSVRLPGLKRWW